MAGQVYDEEEDEFTRTDESGPSVRAMNELRIRQDEEEEMVRRAIADSLVLKKYRPDPKSKVMLLDSDSIKKLIDFRTKKGLPQSLPSDHLEELYEQSFVNNIDYIMAKRRRNEIEKGDETCPSS